MKKEPEKPPPEDSLKRLAEFTKRILQVKKHEIQDSNTSETQKKIDEPCPDT